MKKIFAITVIFALLALCLTSCNFGINRYDFDNHPKYVKGGGTLNEQITALDIEWLSGQVEIKYHTEDSVVFFESGDFKASDDTQMYHYFDGTTLHVRFYRQGMHIGATPNKTLTVFLPQSLKLNYTDVELVSASLYVEELSSASMDIETVSGDVTLDGVRVDSLDASVVSGDFKASFLGDISELDVEAVSGDVHLDFESAPNDMDLETVSGDVTIIHPESDGFTLEYDSTSGALSCELPTSLNRGEYVFGDGSSRYSVESTSADLYIKRKD